eukprot:scaffold91_cov254-Pinguiococcus_pyrenoidosus.AAC.31
MQLNHIQLCLVVHAAGVTPVLRRGNVSNNREDGDEVSRRTAKWWSLRADMLTPPLADRHYRQWQLHRRSPA